jgi:leucyl aminopeptidase (aminopeptidase T)
VGVFLQPPDFAVAFTLEQGVPDRGLERERSAPISTRTNSFSPLLWARSEPTIVDRRIVSREFLHFWAALASCATVSNPIQITATGPGIHVAAGLERWRSRHPQVRLDLLPDHEAWRERLRTALADLGRRPSALRGFAARGELARSIRLFLEGYSPSSGPFQWVASPDEVAARAGGGRLRYELSATGHRGFKSPQHAGPPVGAPSHPDVRVRQMARAVLAKSLRLRRGERVTIESWTSSLEYANAFVLEALRMGAQPLILYQDEPSYWAATREVRPADLGRLGDHQRSLLRRSDVFVSFFGPSDRERFHALPNATKFKLGEYRDSLYRAAARAGARSVQMAIGRVSPPSARMYGVDLEQWRSELIDASLVDPTKLQRRAARLAKTLKRGHELTIRHSNGTHLRLGLRQRTPDVSDGRVTPAQSAGDWNLVQLPAGVVTVAVDERVADGYFRSNVPNSIGVMDTVGEVVEGVWTFAGGRLRAFTYAQGHELFAQSYARAGPGRDRPGTISIGLNERIHTAPLLQDQGIGMVTLQIGRNDQVGGRTRTAWWAWLLLRGADVTIDGTPVVKGGALVT